MIFTLHGSCAASLRYYEPYLIFLSTEGRSRPRWFVSLAQTQSRASYPDVFFLFALVDFAGGFSKGMGLSPALCASAAVGSSVLGACPECGGAGTWIEEFCGCCGGEGRALTPNHFTVSIPSGANADSNPQCPKQGLLVRALGT